MKKGKDGKYHSKVTPAPGVKPIYYEADTVREMRAKRQLIIDEYVNGTNKTDLPFVDLIDEWFTIVKEPRIRSNGTRHTYTNTVNRIKAGFKKSQLSKALTYKHLQSYIDDNYTGAGASTASLAISILKAVCRYGVDEGYLIRDPSASLLTPITAPKMKRSALTEKQVDFILGEAQNYSFGLPFMIAYYTGLRIGEVLALTWADVDFENKKIRVSKTVDHFAKIKDNVKEPKTEASNRLVIMVPDLEDKLRALRGLPHSRVVLSMSGKPYTHCIMYDDIVRYENATGNKLGFTAHYCRHHFATSCYIAGIPLTVAMTWLGHTSYKMTADVYTDIKKTMDKGSDVDRRLSNQIKKVGQQLEVYSTAW